MKWVFVAFCSSLAGCAVFTPRFERPNVTVSSIEMQGGNIMRQSFLVRFNVQNPNNRPLPVSGVHVELNMVGRRVASGVSNSPFVVPPHGEAPFDMNITSNLALALLALSQRGDKHSDSIDYEMTGAASIDLPFMHDLPFHQNGTLDLHGP